MIVRRYGTKIHQVTPRFDARALTEIAFTREGESWPVDEFETLYQKGETKELTAQADGDVKDAVEQELLASLERQLEELRAGLSDGEALLVENQPGVDQPKTRDVTKGVVVEGENRLHFTYTIEPPLRVTICKPAAA